jgi:hypothetical protein
VPDQRQPALASADERGNSVSEASLPQESADRLSYYVLLSSCDAYADCWEPFFKLFATYWPAPRPTVVLNTETRGYEYPGLSILCPRVELGGAGLTWTERLFATLDHAPHQIVLYMQEDYFLKAPVDAGYVEELASLMLERDWSHIDLTRNPSLSEGTPTDEPFLSAIPQRADWRLNTQAGLWTKEAIRTYGRRHESVWEFEWFGTRRAWRREDTFYSVNQAYRVAHAGLNPIPYDGTGIVHGYWDRGVVQELFDRHQIAIDFSQRGFFDEDGAPRPRPPLVQRAARRIRSYR